MISKAIASCCCSLCTGVCIWQYVKGLEGTRRFLRVLFRKLVHYELWLRTLSSKTSNSLKCWEIQTLGISHFYPFPPILLPTCVSSLKKNTCWATWIMAPRNPTQLWAKNIFNKIYSKLKPEHKWLNLSSKPSTQKLAKVTARRVDMAQKLQLQSRKSQAELS